MSRIFDIQQNFTPEDIRMKLTGQPQGRPPCTITSFRTILEEDPRFSEIRYNELANTAEVTVIENKERVTRRWTDADEAKCREYIEFNYGLYAPNKFDDALKLLLEDRRYNPVKNIIEDVVWDEEPRMQQFLTTWLKVEDTPYTREVSRLIFAGGINRLYSPGCKFDDVPVLIGTKQGEGKSSIIRFLAINDDYYGEATSFDDKPSIEQLEGKWILEISELLALTRGKDQEAAKAYLTRSIDKFRPSYGKNTIERPRRCIFIGTTNDPLPLRDATGNRRWYPIYVQSNGYEVYDNEDKIREYILQCWAEAYALYKEKMLPAFADRRIIDSIRQQQAAATTEDWREEAINDYLSEKSVGELTCTALIYRDVINADRKPDKPDLKFINILLAKNPEWEQTGSVAKFTELNTKQRAWKKVSPTEPKLVEVVSRGDDELPF